MTSNRALPVTNIPSEVTCKGCARTMAMADAEIRQRQRGK